MNTLHEKSPCCRAIVRRFGGRRRQCSVCWKTWRVCQRGRGRTRQRISATLIVRYLRREIPSRYAQARFSGISISTLRDRLIRSRDIFLARTPWPTISNDQPLIVIADAMVETFHSGTCTLYIILLRAVSSDEAVITEPLILTGTETREGWQEAFERLPKTARNAILALVCDGNRGLLAVARSHSWIVQRCHFHLLAAIQGRRSRWTRSRHRVMGEQLYQLVRHVITTPDQDTIMRCLTKLEVIGWDTRSLVLRKVLSGFLTSYMDYRTYLTHTHLRLPTTSNAVESLIGSIRDLCYRARGFRTAESLICWVHALLKLKRTIKCNGRRLSTKLPA